MFIRIAFRTVSGLVSAPTIRTYCPGFRFDAAVKILETSFESPALRLNLSWLKLPVEFPRSPLRVSDDDDNILTSVSEAALTWTLISVLCPRRNVSSAGEADTDMGEALEAFIMPILFSDHSLNHTLLLPCPTENCKAFAIPHGTLGSMHCTHRLS